MKNRRAPNHPGRGSLRLFLAAETTEKLRAAYGSIREDLRAAWPRARWAHPEGVHLTFKFLGETGIDRVAGINRAVESVARGLSRIELVTGSAGLFGTPARPRVLWISLRGDLEAAAALARRLEEAVEPLGFPRETRPFKPHLTLARIDSRRPSPAPEALVAKVGETMGDLAFPLEEIVLFQSLLGPGGARYRAQARFALSGGGAADARSEGKVP